jgi:hypothetical protein
MHTTWRKAAADRFDDWLEANRQRAFICVYMPLAFFPGCTTAAIVLYGLWLIGILR